MGVQGFDTIFRWPMDRAPQHLTYIDALNQMWARPIEGNCTLVALKSGWSMGSIRTTLPKPYRGPISTCAAT